MRAVGTMGHEHVQRYGDDPSAFRAMRERLPGASSFLLDTYDTVNSGLPAAIELLAEDSSRGDTVRFDSGDKKAQYAEALRQAEEAGVSLRLILEDGFTDTMTADFEALRLRSGVAAGDQLYGYGGYLVRSDADVLTRDRVAAVYKLSQTGSTPTMKFGDAPGAGKESIPGRPLLCRSLEPSLDRPPGLVIQEGEPVPEGFALLTGAETTHDAAPAMRLNTQPRPEYSPDTSALVALLRHRRAAHLHALSQRS